MADTTDSTYPYTGVPLMPAIIAELASDLFAGRVVKRSELISTVVKEHIRRGGVPSAVDTVSQVKKALQDLASRGVVESTGANGLWRFVNGREDTTVIESAETSDDDEQFFETSVIEVENFVGTGEQTVYVYSFPAYRSLAEREGSTRWPVKIGMSRSEGLYRVVEQLGTSTAEWPVVHIAIRCDDARELERMIHSVLKLRGQHLKNAPGTEWFSSSPAEILDVITQVLGESWL